MDIHRLAEGLSLLGHEVFALYYESMWRSDGEITPKGAVVSRAFPNARVNLVSSRFIKNPIVSRASVFANCYFEIRKVIKEKRIEAVVLYSVPTNGWQAVCCAKRLNVPIIFRSIDVLNQLVPYAVLRPATKWLERRVYSSVDRILTITPKLSEYVIGLGANPNKVGILPLTVDMSLFYSSSDTQEMRHKWGLASDDKVVLFMGTLFPFSGLDSFIPKLKHVIREVQSAKLMIVGAGPQRAELEGIIKTCGLGNRVIITGFQPYQDMPRYINLADVCVNTFIVNSITNDVFPEKTVQFLACGKPLVMRPLAGTKAVILGEEQGVVYVDDDDAMVSKIVSLFESSEYRHKVGGNGLKYVRENYSHEKVVGQLELVLMDLIRAKVQGREG